MNLIQSSETDASTDDVIDWMLYLFPNAKYRRINDASVVKKMIHRISNASESLSLEIANGTGFDLKSVDSWWYRRGYFDFLKVRHSLKSKRHSEISFAFEEFMEKEYDSLEAAIENTLVRSTNSINSFQENNINKVDTLEIAARAGLKIPDTVITNDVNEVRSLFNTYKQIITKGIFRNLVRVHFGQEFTTGFSCDTTLVSESDIEKMEKMYGINPGLPALYQQYIDKAYELRIFCFRDQLYPMAIFTQSSSKTKIDMRIYDRQRPNRCVPYSLPTAIEAKIQSFLNLVGLKSGSIDMIVTPDKEYVFLEINPIGKYQWLRENCNYDIDILVAKYLVGNFYGNER